MTPKASRHHERRKLTGAIALIVLAVLGLLIAIAANLDRSAWGAALLVGVLGPVGGVTLMVLSSRLLRGTIRRSTRVITVLAIVCAVIGTLLSLLALVD